MVFLHSNGVGTARAVRIFKTYGADAVQVMTENPYRLARDIRGIGFRSADAIAMRLGIEKTAMIRLRAGALSHEPFLLVITQLCAGAGFNDSNILANLSRAAIPPLLARCDNADNAAANCGLN